MVIVPSSSQPTFAHQMMISAVLFLITMVETSLGYFSFFYGTTPKLILAMVFIMAIYNKEDIHLATLILVGVIFDSLQGAPLGYTSSVLVLVNIIGMLGKRRFRNTPLSFLWLDFAIVMALVMVYCWICITLFYQAFPSLGPLIFQYSSSVLLFPVVIAFYQGVQYLVEIVNRLK
jgi:rod shape-determining protein MreD